MGTGAVTHMGAHKAELVMRVKKSSTGQIGTPELPPVMAQCCWNSLAVRLIGQLACLRPAETRESVQRGLPHSLPQHLRDLCPRFGEVTNTVSPDSVGSSVASGCSEGEVLNHILHWAVALHGPRGLGAEPWGLPAGCHTAVRCSFLAAATLRSEEAL